MGDPIIIWPPPPGGWGDDGGACAQLGQYEYCGDTGDGSVYCCPIGGGLL
jgi:hypothetical protein